MILQIFDWDARDRSLARAQHAPRTRFVEHANLSILLLASDEINWIYYIYIHV